jgi:TRAP-type C4-dicarboxylate transport system permease small subunit
MRVTSLLAAINRFCAIMAGLILLIGLVSVLYSVFVRTVFHAPAPWAFDLTSYGLLFVVFLSGARTLEQDQHVRIDFLLSRMRGRSKRWIDVAMLTLSLIFLLLLLWATSRETLESIEGDWRSPSIYEFPLGYVYWIMPAGVALMVLTAITKLCAAVRAARLELPV